MTLANERNWIPTSRELPPEGTVVFAMDSGGNVSRFKRMGQLWFLADGSMYVYYVPIFWQPVENASK